MARRTTIVDIIDNVLLHFARPAAATASAADREQLLWALRSYAISAGALSRLSQWHVDGPNASNGADGGIEMGPIYAQVSDMLARSSATLFTGVTDSVANEGEASEENAAPDASVAVVGGKRPREEEPVSASASISAQPPQQQQSFATPDSSEASRRYVSAVSTFFDFTGFMAWRARNSLHSQSLMSLALANASTSLNASASTALNHGTTAAANDSTTSAPAAVPPSSADASTSSIPPSLNPNNGGHNVDSPTDDASSPTTAAVPTASAIKGTGMPAPSSAASPTARSLLSPTSNLVSHHTSPATAAYFEQCRALFPAPALPPFAHDGEFVETVEVLHLGTFTFLSINNLAAPTGLKSDVMRIAEKLGVSLRQVTLAANAALLTIQLFASARLAASADKPPRLVRLCASFGLSVGESSAMSYVLATHGGTLLALSFTQPLHLVNVGRFASLDARGLAVFLQSDRQHMRQGVIHPIDPMMAKISVDMRALMPIEVVSSLCGANIPEEELVKIENTCLWNVMQAEKNGNYGVIATRGNKSASAAAAYLASSNSGAGAGGSSRRGGKGAGGRKVTFGNNKLISALGDLLGNEGDTASSTSASDAEDSDNPDASPRTPAGSALITASDNGDLETIDNDDGLSSKAGGLGLDGHGAASAANDAPYPNDIEYLDDSFRVIAMMIKARNSEGDMKDDDEMYYSTPKTKVEAQLREYAGKQRVLLKRVETRMAATRAAGPWVPRVERVSERLRLSPFERQLLMLLVGNVVSHDVLVAINGRSVMRDGARELTVGYILFVLCASLPERVACRKCFFESSPLIANGLITLSVGTSSRTKFNTDLMEYLVDIDRSIVDYLMGTEVDPDEMVQGSRLYTPDVPLSHVALPVAVKEGVLSTIEHYSLFAKCKEKCGFGKGLGTGGSGLVFLFHGPSGTGKTMLANAVAHDLKKKILLVNLLQYRGEAKAPDVLRYVFREAKLNDAIIFFDECESFFEQRENNSVVTAVLAEFEKYSGMIILATNRAQVIDEAMNRRISVMIEFKLPDHQMREQIWRTHLPANLKIAPEVNVQELAMDYELSGGLIRNAVLAAMSSAVGREQTDSPTLQLADLRLGAKQQLRGFFQATETASQEYITPHRSLNELIVDRTTKDGITSIAKSVKSRNTLFAQWGFNEKEYDDQGEICLFYGPSGTGKSLAAEGIAYECSATIRLCNVSEMFVTNTFNIQAVFDEARKLGAIVVFDQAQNLFDYSEMASKISQLIQYHAVRYPRPVIVIATTSPSGVSSIDTRASRLLFNSEIAFQLPTRQLRRELWRRSIPPQAPMSDDVDFERLSGEQLSAKAIRSICFAVCCKAALLPVGKQIVSNALVLEVQEEYLSRERRRNTHSSMFT